MKSGVSTLGVTSLKEKTGEITGEPHFTLAGFTSTHRGRRVFGEPASLPPYRQITGKEKSLPFRTRSCEAAEDAAEDAVVLSAGNKKKRAAEALRRPTH